MFRIDAKHANAPLAPNDLAFLANGFDRCSNFHSR